MKIISLKTIIILISFLLIIPLVSSCDQTLLDIHTQVNTDYSGTRTIDLAVKTEYIQKGEVALSSNQSLFDGILEALPEGEIKTFEEGDYTHFSSTITFEDVNFLQHISIDNFSETPPGRFYARMEKEDFFLYSEFFFEDYIDMKIDDTLLQASGQNSALNRINDLVTSDSDILSITYQIKFPVEIVNHNADLIGDDNIAIWNLKYGDQEKIMIEGKKTKFLTYFLIGVLGLIGLLVLFIISALIFGSRKRKAGPDTKKPLYSYDNYFKKDRYFEPEDEDDF